MSCASQNSADDKAWELNPLTPVFIEAEHGCYVRAINSALEKPGIFNIALSGDYGVGKSSILQRVAKHHQSRAVELSLSTLAPVNLNILYESVPKQATTKTNRIQQEIVKQLLYRTEPGRVAGSRFQRIESFHWGRELVIASVIGLVLMVIFLLNGWTDRLSAVFSPLFNLISSAQLLVLGLSAAGALTCWRLWHWWLHIREMFSRDKNEMSKSRFRWIEGLPWWRDFLIASIFGLVIFLSLGWPEQILSEISPMDERLPIVHLVILGLGITAVLTFRYLFHGRIHIKQFTAGAATVTLNDNSVSYFDQYLDEIVYFFEVSGHNLVIFEDIDRFDDSYIFETLGSLNALLNASPQLDRPIRFIYAIKDSIFDQAVLKSEGRKDACADQGNKDPAQAEVVRANRTKFFDLIIPVVPFITHQSAKDLATQLLNDYKYEVSRDLIVLAVRYVPDMRLLKNVCNEFLIFHHRIFSKNGDRLGLSRTALFAMMLYKSTHMSDFEHTRLGKSKLDKLYKASRDLINANIRRIQNECVETRKRLAILDSIESRSLRLGELLLAHIRRTANAVKYNFSRQQYVYNGRELAEEELKKTCFWTEFVEAPDDPSIVLRNGSRQELTISRSDFAEAIDNSLDSDDWRASDVKWLESKLSELDGELEFLSSADMASLIDRMDYKLLYDGYEQTFAEISERLLGQGLAYELVSAGYINRNFTLYTSTFHGTLLSADAQRFLMQHVERAIMDEHFELDDSDVVAVLRECERNDLKKPAFYNIAILDSLLRTDKSAAGIMLKSLVSFGTKQQRFIQAYLNGGSEKDRFIEDLTMHTSRILIYLIDQAKLDDNCRLAYVSTALSSLADEIKYHSDTSVSEYLMKNYAELPSLTTTEVNVASPERIAAVFSDAGIRVSKLKHLSNPVRDAFIERDLYEITRDNLAIAFGGSESLALDVALEVNEKIYQYLLRNLDAYLSAIDSELVSVNSAKCFIPVIKDVLAKADGHISDVIASASKHCIVEELKDISEEAWPALAQHERIPATFINVSSYISSIGSIDTSLAKLLSSAGCISDVEDADDDERDRLARSILAADKKLQLPSLRVKLVKSLGLQNYIDVNMIEPEEGELFSLLLKKGVIADNEAAYVHLLKTDWSTRELVIETSSSFKDYMALENVQNDIDNILESRKIDSNIKRKIIERSDELTQGGSSQDLAAIARYAVKNNLEVPINVIELMATNNISCEYIISLLEPYIEDLEGGRVLDIIRSLREPYSTLGYLGRKLLNIPNTQAHHALLVKLKQLCIVSSYETVGDMIKVYRKRK